jgi:lambda family phage portal protein
MALGKRRHVDRYATVSMGNRLNWFERQLGVIAPRAAMRRASDRLQLKEFAAGGSSRGRQPTGYSQGASEAPRKQRERIDAIWAAREMEEIFCIIAGILDRCAMYTVGSLEYQAATGDEKADQEYEDYFHAWCGECDYTGRHRLRTLAELGLRSTIRDGEHGWVEHFDPKTMEYRLQAIEADRIGNPQHHLNDDKNINGIRIDDRGKVIAYDIQRRSLSNQYTLEGSIGPDRFIHLFKPTRSDQYHGVSILKPVIPHAQDLYELLGFEKIAAKFAASWAAFIRLKDPNAANGMNWDGVKKGANGLPTFDAQAGSVVRLTDGEGVDFAPGTQRPSGAFMALVDAIIREIAIGMNLPYGFVYNMASFGGVTARLEVQQAQRTFRRWQEIIVNTMLERVKKRVLLIGIASKRIRATKNWNKGSWQFGATITGDVGHQVQADATMVQYGVKTRTRWAAELGGDFADLANEASSEIQLLKKIAIRDDVPLELLVQSLGNPTELLASMAKAKAGISDGPPPVPGVFGEIGDKGAKQVLDLLSSVGRGEIDRDSARNTLVSVYGMDYAVAAQIVP